MSKASAAKWKREHPDQYRKDQRIHVRAMRRAWQALTNQERFMYLRWARKVEDGTEIPNRAKGLTIAAILLAIVCNSCAVAVPTNSGITVCDRCIVVQSQ